MKINNIAKLAALGLVAITAACTSTTRDQGIDSGEIVNLAPSVWVDPDGCKHWVIDDGVEGYMSPVLNLDGTPDCV
ncbi:MAG: hypothetical protein AB8B85_21670 [Paracoccaceae bacterium]